MDEPRFWLDDWPVTNSVAEWYGVVDEERGGVVAYFGREEDALAYIAWRRCVPVNDEERRVER